jgi:uncharacterized protein
MERKGLLFLAIAIFLGICIGAFILGNSLKRFKTDDRFISVKGLSEREVKADFVIWSLKIRMAMNDLNVAGKSMEEARKKVMDFLTRNGIDSKDIIQQNLEVLDKQAREYSGENAASMRYIIQETVEVRSTNVDQVLKVSRMTSELLSAGVIISSQQDYQGSSLKFIFTRLNEVKPVMLTEAIQNARHAAEQFTKESNTKLGKLRKASQGYFSVMDRDQSLAQDGEGRYYDNNNSDIHKKIRVVISVDYSLE